MASSPLDAAQGCILGALLGDSLGSYLEFVGKPKAESVVKAFTMPGGGHWGVSPGQITDDGEQTLCMLRGMLSVLANTETQSSKSSPMEVTYSKEGSEKKEEANGEEKKVEKIEISGVTKSPALQNENNKAVGEGGASTLVNLSVTSNSTTSNSEKPSPTISSSQISPTTSPTVAVVMEKTVAEKLTHRINEACAQLYCRWTHSQPFDTGRTTFAALGWCTTGHPKHAARNCHSHAAEKCGRSKSNGSLMRSTPMGVCCYKLNPDEVQVMCKLDSTLTHPNASVVDCVTLYSIAIGHLIRQNGDSDGAIQLCQQCIDIGAKSTVKGKVSICEEVQGWFHQAVVDCKPEPYHPNSGFIKIAFIHAFRHLKRQTKWMDAMKETLEGGGDTDTNACIISGLLGACYGLSNLPSEYVQKVLKCDTKATLLRQRPTWLQPTAKVLDEIALLLQFAPDTL